MIYTRLSTCSASKRAFSLLEIMIALMILSVIGTVTVVQVKKLINAHRFEGEVADLFIALQEAQVLSSVYQTDLALDICVKSGKCSYRFSTDEPFPARKFKQDAVTLAHTHHVNFDNAKSTELHFDIYSGGRIEPRGVLAFHGSHKNGRVLWFDLQYGHLLKFFSRKPVTLKQKIPAPPKQNRY